MQEGPPGFVWYLGWPVRLLPMRVSTRQTIFRQGQLVHEFNDSFRQTWSSLSLGHRRKLFVLHPCKRLTGLKITKRFINVKIRLDVRDIRFCETQTCYTRAVI